MTSTSSVTVITGGAGGMGLATARIVGRDHVVVLSDVSSERLDQAARELTALGIACEAYPCDVTDRGAVDRLAHHASSRGTVVAVVHTAGVSPQMGSAEMIMRINAIGTINVTEAFLAIATEGFRIVNVASMAAHLSPRLLMPERSYRYALTDPQRFFIAMMRRCRIAPKAARPGMAYSVSKNFVVWYSRRMAARFGAKGARIVSVSPGSFDTAMGRLEEKSGAAAMLRFASLQRFGKVEEIAEVLAFCASDKPGYLTGTDIVCDGGVVAGITWKDLLALARPGHPDR
jgi:NAD(P)-dependent dehydrogenase (short-subunit alcohol dehydrogenase family)